MTPATSTPGQVVTSPPGDAADRHTPVLAQRCVELLAPALQKPGAVLIDGTLGMGGHSEAVLEACPQARVIGIDRDQAAIELAGARLAGFGERFMAVHTTYDLIPEVVAANGGKVNAILLDLGVSSLQLDEDERGFSYSRDALLDMRMDTSTGQSAAEFLATAPEAEIRRVLRSYGEERFAGAIAKRIVAQRALRPITRTGELAEIVRESIPAPARRKGGNPAKRTFQGLRIAVNAELTILEQTLPHALAVLPVGGRLVVESYHSLEDRMVKRAFTKCTTVNAPPDLPVVPERALPTFSALTRGAEQANDAECARNPRSASVRLRAVARIRKDSERTSA